MKKAKKLTAVLLAVLMILSAFGISLSAFAANCNCDHVPVIYVRGRASLWKDKSVAYEDREEIPNYDMDMILQRAKEDLLADFATGMLTGDYSAWKEGFVDMFREIAKDWVLDENAQVTNNSGIGWTWSEKTINKNHSENVGDNDENAASSYIYRYFYQYDCRLSPLTIADGLHDYIEAVKRVTGHSKVRIIARCLGTSIATAYFYKYGWEDVENVVIYNAIMNGTVVTDALFTGDIKLNDQQIDYVLTQELNDDDLFEFLKIFVTLLNEVKALGLATDEINKIIAEVAPQVIPETLMVSYGTSPGYWAMVSPEKYEQARDFVFADAELREKYKELIRLNDEYYYNVQSNIEEMYKQMEADGVHVSFVTKYGSQAYPLNDNCAEQSDLIITLSQQALKTYSAPFGEKLSDEYIAQANENGNSKYISPDKIIDASTALFPDTTWYIKNLTHNDFPASVDLLMFKILCRYDNSMTVFTDPNYPQYLVFEGDEQVNTLTPMTEDNLGVDLEKPEKVNVFIRFLTKLLEFLTKLINGELDFDIQL